ncbi:acetolactate synthase small subunit [Flavobacterium quisquiliarum]|uniref:Acetolactate synthase small subunit n=1 Tax=Flavobacterium quisquiliarum TaxID=1834436 RepID=A0ABV8W046_9FLAO|nr:acetolactate synthase small subunit [Flavobacterium quisquiliarum]MBW1654653.1 acetolactate synthase small subunit [Flavobacterium quisquiliarum]NWL01663.1 acetolactate synthase small subunit [Flavobacterium collinsii]
MKEQFTLTFYTEDQMGLVSKTAVIFSRRKISFESFNISSCEINGMYRFTIVVIETFETVRNLALQIEKIIDVYKCYFNTNSEIVHTQTVLFKLPIHEVTKDSVQELLQKHNATYKILERDYTIVEVTAQEIEIDLLTNLLMQNGLIEFVKSPLIALIKSGKSFREEFEGF